MLQHTERQCGNLHSPPLIRSLHQRQLLVWQTASEHSENCARSESGAVRADVRWSDGVCDERGQLLALLVSMVCSHWSLRCCHVAMLSFLFHRL